MLGYKFIRFPFFKGKAVTFSYDDSVTANKKFLDIINRYNIKCTFNLNTGMFRPEEDDERFLTYEDTIKLFSNQKQHEIALHGHKHLSLANCSYKDGIVDVIDNKRMLEKMFGCIVDGMAYANGSYNERVINYLKDLGVKYARTVNSTHSFGLPKNWLELNPTCHHNDEKLFELVEKFNNVKYENSFLEPMLFYLWGHSYEFDYKNNWDRIEDFCKKIANQDDVWYCTNGELYDYVNAFKSLRWSLDNKMVYNPTLIDVYFQIDRKPFVVKKGETLYID